MSNLIRAMADAQSVPLAVLDTDQTIIAWNQTMVELSGLPFEELVNRKLNDAFDIRADEHEIQFAARQPFQLPVAAFFMRDRPEGQRSTELDWLSIRFAPFTEPGGPTYWVASVVGSEVMFGDNADLVGFIESLKGHAQMYREASAELADRRDKMREAEKLAGIGQLAAGVAHEVNNPVGYVYSNLSILRDYARDVLDLLHELTQVERRVSAGEPLATVMHDLFRRVEVDALREDLLNIVDESLEGIDRVKQIVRALKDFSHVDQDVFIPYDLHKGIETTLRVAHNEIKYQADVVCEFGELPEVHCVPSRINQVVLNLVVNAAQAMRQRGRILVRTRAENDHVVVEVEDNGDGMSETVKQRIFEPFFTTKEKGKGTGLGLPLSYSIVREHGGELEVTSEPGSGSCFRIRLPVHRKGD